MDSGPARRPVVSPVDGARLLPVAPPQLVNGFRFAVTADGARQDGTPYVSPERGFITDPAERDRLLGYLGAGALVMQSRHLGTDGFQRSRRPVVPIAYRTDGTWVWPASVEYYLREHQVAPEPEFYRTIVEHGYRCPPVPDEVVVAAREAGRVRSEQGRQRLAEFQAAEQTRDSERTGDLTRFQPEVDAALRAIGWYAGRDVHEQVSQWLAEALPAPTDDSFERDGLPRYEPTGAARRVLDEFGGLSFSGGRPGVAAATSFFTVFPGPEYRDLTEFRFDVQRLAEDLEQPVFQVGQVERGMGALAVSRDGGVYLVGPAVLYAGATIDQALTNMILGLAFPPESQVDR